ncbi:group xv phospholipase a2 [Anaeramoeba ignava]|uniref:Group xv phospholipase a2 n=1 Tax=Anaeramoeba ignava TaxID=1746090 RepID=A0A9Q0LQX6_ANAIG|nr:group xv phospholipase a2 [Anaeramoeba ignava]
MVFLKSSSKILFIFVIFHLCSLSLLSNDFEKQYDYDKDTFIFKKVEQELEEIDPIESAKKLAEEIKMKNDRLNLNPIIFIPGLGGSKIETKLDNFNTKHWFCEKNKDWFRVWLTVELYAPEVVEKSYNQKGVSVRPISGIEGVVNLDPTLFFISEVAYFSRMSKVLEDLGYQEDKNLFALPYDWRLAPNNLTDYFELLKYTVEYSYSINNGMRVNLMTHSMGCTIATYFLANQTQEWKDKYISTFIPLSPPMGGVFKGINSLVEGENFGIPIIIGSEIKDLEVSLPSIYYFLPHSPFWTQPVVKTASKDYYPTFDDYNVLFNDLGLPQYSHQLLQLTWKDSLVFNPPGVPTYLQIGSGIKTPIYFQFETDLNGKHEIIYGNGDGTCNHDVMIIPCTEWAQGQTQPVQCYIWNGAGHQDTISKDEIIEQILQIISNAN